MGALVDRFIKVLKVEIEPMIDDIATRVAQKALQQITVQLEAVMVRVAEAHQDRILGEVQRTIDGSVDFALHSQLASMALELAPSGAYVDVQPVEVVDVVLPESDGTWPQQMQQRVRQQDQQQGAEAEDRAPDPPMNVTELLDEEPSGYVAVDAPSDLKKRGRVTAEDDLDVDDLEARATEEATRRVMKHVQQSLAPDDLAATIPLREEEEEDEGFYEVDETEEEEEEDDVGEFLAQYAPATPSPSSN